MEYYSCLRTSKPHIPFHYLRTPASPKSQYSVSLLQSEETRQGVTEYKARGTRSRGKANDGERQEGEGGTRESPGESKREEKRDCLSRGGVSPQYALAAEAQPSGRESLCGAMIGDTLLKRCDSLRSVIINVSKRAKSYVMPTEHPNLSPPTSAAACEDTPTVNYSLFCQDEAALEVPLHGTATRKIHYLSATLATASQIRAAQMFSCISTQAAAPPDSQEHHGAPPQPQQPRMQQQPQSQELPQKQQQQPQRKEAGKLPLQASRALQVKVKTGRNQSRRGGSGGGRRRRHTLQQPLRSYSMLDIENDAFTGVHENDVESEAGQCLRNVKTICGFCLLCFGFFLLVTCPKMKQTSPLTFYYILCTMLAELCIALCFGCSICMLACLVGEQGAVYANATCGLLHRVAEGIAHYTLTGFGGYLLYNFRALEGVWYASGEEEQEKFLYLLTYVGCEATMSLLYSLQTLGTLFGVCRFIVIKVYSKLSGRGDVFFLHGDAPVIYASIDQYSHALRHMRNPVEVAFHRRHQHQQCGSQHDLNVYSDRSKDLY